LLAVFPRNTASKLAGYTKTTVFWRFLALRISEKIVADGLSERHLRRILQVQGL
jgi:hypothetical protein